MPVIEALNPAQQEVLDVLGEPGARRPTFDAGLRAELRAELEAGLWPLVTSPDGAGDPSPLHVSKHTLAAVHGCEVRFVHEDAVGFPGWSVPTARGSVAHKAIELSVHLRGAPSPLELVDEAMARLAESDRSLADWLGGLHDVERAELRAEANDRVAKFLECWPPLRPSWRPVTESRLSVELCGGRVALRGKVDLVLGQARGTTAGKVLVDLKTGSFAPVHVDDLRFYALLDAIRVGVPPRRLATYYLDAGRFVCEDVTEAMLFSATARVVDGVRHLVDLRTGARTPLARVGPACRWCPLLDGCGPGRQHLDAADDR